MVTLVVLVLKAQLVVLVVVVLKALKEPQVVLEHQVL
jgi:hypothetical protein